MRDKNIKKKNSPLYEHNRLNELQYILYTSGFAKHQSAILPFENL